MRRKFVEFDESAAEDAVGAGVFRIGIDDGLREGFRFFEIVCGESGFGVFELKREIGGGDGDGGVEIVFGFGEVAGFGAVVGELDEGAGEEEFVLVGGFG